MAVRTTQTADKSRPIFEHVDDVCGMCLSPLTQQTQQLFARGMSDSSLRNQSQLQAGAQPRRVRSGTQSFTAREWQVFDHLLSGLSSKQIAYELQISSRTVEIHRANLMRKMGVRNTVSLIRAAFAAA
jgi:DNA-binding NarL/FixJ family response regulator